jgi:hypothetical protein
MWRNIAIAVINHKEKSAGEFRRSASGRDQE